MIAVVIFIRSARVSSLADDCQDEAQGHDSGGDYEDDQVRLASGVAPGLARQPAKDDPGADEPTLILEPPEGTVLPDSPSQ
jgi:hypothetical protein